MHQCRNCEHNGPSFLWLQCELFEHYYYWLKWINLTRLIPRVDKLSSDFIWKKKIINFTPTISEWRNKSLIKCVSCWMTFRHIDTCLHVDCRLFDVFALLLLLLRYVFPYQMGERCTSRKNSISTWSNEKRIRAEQDFPASDDVKC